MIHKFLTFLFITFVLVACNATVKEKEASQKDIEKGEEVKAGEMELGESVAQIEDSLNEAYLLHGLRRISDTSIYKEMEPMFLNDEVDLSTMGLTSLALVDTNEFYSIFKENEIEVMLNSEKFYPPLHSFPDTSENDYIYTIDGSVFWGTDGLLPETKVRRISVKIGGMEIPIPTAATDGLYNPNFGCNSKSCYNFVYLSRDQRRLYVKMENGDGAGYYQVVWIFKDNIYFDRVVERGM